MAKQLWTLSDVIIKFAQMLFASFTKIVRSEVRIPFSWVYEKIKTVI